MCGISLILHALGLCAVSAVVFAERRSDDVTIADLQNVIQQQAAAIQTLQSQVQTLQTKMTAMENVIGQQSATIQTLQTKMTAMENVTKRQMTVIQTLQTKVASSENVTQQHTAAIQTLQTKTTSSANITEQQSAAIQTLQTKMTFSENVTGQLWAAIQTLQTKMGSRLEKNVAFTASFGPNQDYNVGVGGVVKFNHVITNIGGGYSSATGTFTAPVPGTYGFFLSIRSDDVHGWVDVVLQRNGQDLVHAAAQGPPADVYDKGTAFVTLNLTAGDKVSARQHAGATYLEKYDFTTFSGFLLFAD